jgi:hypothetical protein
MGLGELGVNWANWGELGGRIDLGGRFWHNRRFKNKFLFYAAVLSLAPRALMPSDAAAPCSIDPERILSLLVDPADAQWKLFLVGRVCLFEDDGEKGMQDVARRNGRR